MKQEKNESVRYRVVLTYEDGSMEFCTVTAAVGSVVMMVARGWLMASVLGLSVRYYQIDEKGRCMGIGGEYVR